jgi:hypothetical protein
MTTTPKVEKKKTIPLTRLLRITIGTSIIIMAIIYLLLIVAGKLPQLQRIDAITLVTVVAALIVGFIFLAPETITRIKILQIQGFKLEMLEKIKEKQAEQEDKLEDIKLLLPLLLSNNERKHLINLWEGKTKDYSGSHALRSELRRLRGVKLLKSFTNRHIAELKDDPNQKYDISTVVELTFLGKQWAKKIREIEDAEKE